jgi:metallo-beta-lactamase family protein
MSTVLLISYPAQGTLGRILQDGASRVRIMGQEVQVRARIRTLDLYSGHADATELAAWFRERLPVRQDTILVHGEEPALSGLKARLAPFVSSDRLHAPSLDDAFDLTSEGARTVEVPRRRMEPDRVGRPDSHNELSELILNIGQAVGQAADQRAKAVIIRRLRRALDNKPS